MSLIKGIRAEDSPSVDAFGRWRSSEPANLFDSKQLYDNAPLFWDDAETSGSGTSSAHSADEAATTISVGASTAGTRVRQTYRWFNYLPGKSQLISMTFSEMATSTGITKRVGQFNDDNGLFLQSAEGTVSVVRRSHVTGSPVDTAVNQANWNLDTMDGNGPSGITVDFDKTQILVIDYQWLGVGRVRFGFNIGGVAYYVHEMNHANDLSVVYMSTPNLPLRYEIANDGNGAADDFVHICTSVSSEGGKDGAGQTRHVHTDEISNLDSGSDYAALGIRLKSTRLGTTVNIISVNVLITSPNEQGRWMLALNPTVAGTFTYSDETNSAVQTAVGTGSNTVSGGTYIEGGFFTTDSREAAAVRNTLKLGSAIDGTPDEIILTISPFSNNVDTHVAIEWQELD